MSGRVDAQRHAVEAQCFDAFHGFGRVLQLREDVDELARFGDAHLLEGFHALLDERAERWRVRTARTSTYSSARPRLRGYDVARRLGLQQAAQAFHVAHHDAGAFGRHQLEIAQVGQDAREGFRLNRKP